jgi:hypothetical protein
MPKTAVGHHPPPVNRIVHHKGSQRRKELG